MRQAKLIAICMLCMSFGVPLFADIPTTRPSATTRPAHLRVPAPKDWAKVDNVTHHFHYAVPKTWRALGRSDENAQYSIPGAGGQSLGELAVLSYVGCHAASIDALAANPTQGLPPDQKFVSGEMTQMGDKPAYMIITEGSAQGVFIRNGVPSKFVVKTRNVVWEAIEGTQYYQIILMCESKNYARNMAFAQRVVDSVESTGSPATRP